MAGRRRAFQLRRVPTLVGVTATGAATATSGFRDRRAAVRGTRPWFAPGPPRLYLRLGALLI
jgi:hypothetical protein